MYILYGIYSQVSALTSIMTMSPSWRHLLCEQSVSAVFYQPVFLHTWPSVKQHCTFQEKWTSSTSRYV